MAYKGIRVKSGSSITIGHPLGITTPTFDIEEGMLYTLQFKICNKTPHDILNYIYVGEQSLGSLDLTTFKTTEVIEGYQEKLCFVEFISNKTASNVRAKIGRLQDIKDKVNTECFLIREIQFEKGSLTDYKPNHQDNLAEWDKLQTQINQTNSKVNIMAKKTELDKLGNEVSSAKASIVLQAGLIKNKVSEGDFSTLIRQSPIDVQYAFNGVNPRYTYTDDGFYMKSDSGYNKASIKRGSFYTYNYNNGVFLGGFTPVVHTGWDNVGQGVINAKESYFFTIAKDSTLELDTQDTAPNLTDYFLVNFRDRTGEGAAYLYGCHAFAPLYIHDFMNANGKRIFNAAEIQALKGKFNNIYDGYDNKVFDFGQYIATNSRHWDWGGMNLTNCNWIGNYAQSDTLPILSKLSNNTSMIDDLEVINVNNKLALTKSSVLAKSNSNNEFDYSQLIYSLVQEVKQLKEELKILKNS